MQMTRERLEAILADDTSVMELLQWKTQELKNALGIEFSYMKDYDQKNVHHCYSLLEHTLRTVTGIERKNRSCQDYMELRTAALFHDIGKPAVAFWDEKRKQRRFFGHAKKSKEIAGKILRQLKYTEEEQQRILFYVEYHDEFMSWCLPQEKEMPGYSKATMITESGVLEAVRKKADILGNDQIELLQRYDYLMDLRKADAGAQSEEVRILGQVVMTRERKIQRICMIQDIIRQELQHTVQDVCKRVISEKQKI